MGVLNILDQPRHCFFKVFIDFTFPYHNRTPAHQLKIAIMLLVVLDIALEFWKPIVLSCLGNVCANATFVSMPKASMNEYNSMILGKDNVGFSGERSNIFSIAKPL